MGILICNHLGAGVGYLLQNLIPIAGAIQSTAESALSLCALLNSAMVYVYPEVSPAVFSWAFSLVNTGLWLCFCKRDVEACHLCSRILEGPGLGVAVAPAVWRLSRGDLPGTVEPWLFRALADDDSNTPFGAVKKLTGSARLPQLRKDPTTVGL